MEHTLRAYAIKLSHNGFLVLILVLVEHTLRDVRDAVDESNQFVLILVLVEHTLREQLLQRTLFQSITLVNSEYLSVFIRK